MSQFKRNVSDYYVRSIERSGDLLLIELCSGLTFFVDLMFTIDHECDVEHGIDERRVDIKWISVYNRHKKTAFKWNDAVDTHFYNDIEHFILIESEEYEYGWY